MHSAQVHKYSCRICTGFHFLYRYKFQPVLKIINRFKTPNSTFYTKLPFHFLYQNGTCTDTAVFVVTNRKLLEFAYRCIQILNRTSFFVFGTCSCNIRITILRLGYLETLKYQHLNELLIESI